MEFNRFEYNSGIDYEEKKYTHWMFNVLIGDDGEAKWERNLIELFERKKKLKLIHAVVSWNLKEFKYGEDSYGYTIGSLVGVLVFNYPIGETMLDTLLNANYFSWNPAYYPDAVMDWIMNAPNLAKKKVEYTPEDHNVQIDLSPEEYEYYHDSNWVYVGQGRSDDDVVDLTLSDDE
jgi:hypothetical protein